MASTTRVFLLFPLVAVTFGVALPVLLPQLMQEFSDNLGVAFGTTVALCSTFLAQVPVLSFLSTGCLVACVSLLSLASGVIRCLQQIRHTRQFVASALTQRIDEPSGDIAQLIKTLGLAYRVDVVATREPLAFCYGLRQPRICISLGLIERFSIKELEAVLLHEYRHLQQRDPQRILIVRTIAATFFYLPFLSEIEKYFLVCTEIEADRATMERMGSRRYLTAALHSLLSGRPESSASSATLALGGFDATEERVDYLLGLRPLTRPSACSPAMGISLASLGALAAALLWMLNTGAIHYATCPVTESLNLSVLALAATTPAFWATLLSSAACAAMLFLAPRRLIRS